MDFPSFLPRFTTAQRTLPWIPMRRLLMNNKFPIPPPQEKKKGLQTSAKTTNLWNVKMISNFGDTQEKGVFFGLSILFTLPHRNIKNLNTEENTEKLKNEQPIQPNH